MPLHANRQAFWCKDIPAKRATLQVYAGMCIGMLNIVALRQTMSVCVSELETISLS
jgi:hypothetical protein